MTQNTNHVDMVAAAKMLKADPAIRRLAETRNRAGFDARVRELLNGIDVDQVLDYLWDDVFKSVTARWRLSDPDATVLLAALGRIQQTTHVQELAGTLAELKLRLTHKNAGRP